MQENYAVVHKMSRVQVAHLFIFRNFIVWCLLLRLFILHRYIFVSITTNHLCIQFLILSRHDSNTLPLTLERGAQCVCVCWCLVPAFAIFIKNTLRNSPFFALVNPFYDILKIGDAINKIAVGLKFGYENRILLGVPKTENYREWELFSGSDKEERRAAGSNCKRGGCNMQR